MTRGRKALLGQLQAHVRRLEIAIALLVDAERAASGRLTVSAETAAAGVERARLIISEVRLAASRLLTSPLLSADERYRASGVLEAAELLLDVRRWLGPGGSVRSLCAPESVLH